MSANLDVWASFPKAPALTKDGKLTTSVYNASLILTYHEACRRLLAFDAFRQEKTKRRIPPWGGQQGDFTNADVPRLKVWFQEHFDLALGTETVSDAVTYVCDENRFDSLRDELLGFTWDGEARIDTLFPQYFGTVDTPYTRIASRNLALSMAARALLPACKVDTMCILEGPQGVRKSSGLRALAGAHLFSDTAIDFHSKDGMLQLQGVWLQEVAELDAFYRTDQTAIKAFLTKTSDRFRPPYAREIITFLRRNVLAGTTNDTGYLGDATGARRFLPVTCTRVDTDAITRDRPLIFAEAAACVQAGDPWWYDERDSIADQARAEQSARHQEHAWVEPISQWIATRPASSLREGLTTYQILTECLGIEKDRIRHSETIQVGRILSTLGWRKSVIQVMRGGARIRPYLPPDSMIPETANIESFDD